MNECCAQIHEDMWAMSGTRVPGDLWECPECGKEWVHHCSEEEGCGWE